MKKQKYYLAIGALVCSAILGAVFTSQLTYAADVNHNAAIQVVDDYEDELQTYFDDNYPNLSVTFNKYELDYGPFYKPDSINAYIKLAWGYSLETQYSLADVDLPNDPGDTMITNFLTEKGFQKYAEIAMWPGYDEYLNSETGIICLHTAGLSLEGIFCSYIEEEPQVSAAWATFLNSIGAAYYASQSKLPAIPYEPEIYATTNVDVAIENSDYSPYQYMIFPINNFVGLFYRQSPTSDWVYFTGTQAPLDCSEFTGEVQKGFAGYVCYNGDQESRVVVATEVADETPTENSASSGTKTPNTGIFTSGDQNSIVATSIVAISTIGIVVYISRYIINRQKSKVYFDKN